ncbi:MAG: EAL domain-containing protein [Beijerinckiaceae bacterium]|nr:EAL domain-containing protein [Beijerinckiaceae bacterium]MCZ8300340.1 EAL domain-containing protein [Beijerinckiaceae bacterium]
MAQRIGLAKKEPDIDSKLAGDGYTHASRVRAAQIGAIMRFTPMAFLVNCGNAALVSSVVSPFSDTALLVAWNVTLIAICGMGLRAWFNSRRFGPPRKASVRATRRAMVQAGLLGTLWAAPALFWFPKADANAQLVIGTVATGMICAGGFALATVRQAAHAYVLLLTAGSLLGLMLSSTPHAAVLATLLVAYAATVMRSVEGTAALFTRQFLAEIELGERGQTIELLLAEFEEKSSDWLFELDPEGRLIKFSARLAEASARNASELHAARLTALLSPSGANSLAAALGNGQPFRNLVVDAHVGAEQRWWSLTAGPIADDLNRQRGWRGVGSDITEAKVARDRVDFLANTDTLTGLPNRRCFLERATQSMSGMNESGARIAIGCIDIDNFKLVNDRLGHPQGDQLLCLVSEILRDWAQGGIEICRFGGDEFGLLFPASADVETVMASAGELAARLARTYVLDGKEMPATASIGIAIAEDDGEDVHSLMRKADFALYRSKHSGGASVSLYDPVMHSEVEEAAKMQEDLTRAIDNNQLKLVYQPIVELSTGEVAGFEALLRWHHPERGVVPPDRFIPVAEDSGLIVTIGDWVLRQACLDALSWPTPLSVSVNVSPLQISKSEMATTIAGILEATGLPPHRLELEITEAVFIEHEKATLAFLSAMRALGVTVALDDFGTGYSSLGYLGRFPIDKLKIDKSFVVGQQPLSQRTAIVQATISMARSLGLQTTAEGIEDERILAWLRMNGCIFGQGFFFAKPMPNDDIGAYLGREPLPAPIEDKSAQAVLRKTA